jgi:outer membrane protein assembly factor BamB
VNNKLYRLNETNGAIEWDSALLGDFANFQRPNLSASNDIILFTSYTDKTLKAFNVNTRNTVWSVPYYSGPGISSVIAKMDKVYFSSLLPGNIQKAFCYDIATGTLDYGKSYCLLQIVLSSAPD